MLGLEKRVDALREMQGADRTETEGPAKTTATTGIMLALVALVAAIGVYFAVDGKYAGKITAYETRINAMESKVADAMNAPKEMARKVIVANMVEDMSHKVAQLKGQVEGPAQEKLAKMEELIKGLQADIK